MPDRLRLAVGILTMRRPEILAETLAELARQVRAPDRVLVCATAPGDVGAAGTMARVEVMLCTPGTSVQRNRLIDAAADCDVLVFFDDDFLAEPDYLAATERAFLDDPAVVVTTGTVLADGVKGPGIGAAEGREILRRAGPAGPAGARPVYNGYGCNMAVRLQAVRERAVRFDEGMPYYAWYEDLDFTRRLAAGAGMVRLPGARGVHLGTKMGRGPGVRLGYAQVVNPVYLARKGSYAWNRALRSVARHVAMNLLRAGWPEPWVDRWGRLRGNVAGLRDLLGGHCDPARAGLL